MSDTRRSKTQWEHSEAVDIPEAREALDQPEAREVDVPLSTKKRYNSIAKFINKYNINTACADSGVCLAFGRYANEIKDYFAGFTSFKYTVSPIKRIGHSSANGFVNEIEYQKIDEETGETSKGEVGERKEFKTKKSYTFCYDSEDFHHLTLKGTGGNLSFFVKVGNKLVYKKEGFDLVDKFTFTSKDFNFRMGESYSIVIKQNETTIFNGKIDSQGCM